MHRYLTYVLLISSLLLASCRQETPLADAYGNFEAREVIIAAENAGQIVSFDIEEGQTLEAGLPVAQIDTADLQLKRNQLRATINTIRRKLINVQPQLDILLQQQLNLDREIKRLENLVADNVAPQKQLDDLNGQRRVVLQQMAAAKQQNNEANQRILSEIEPLEAQIAQITHQIKRSTIINPVKGTVLLKLAEPFEMTSPGKPLYKIADLSEMTLRVFVSGSQLPEVKIGQPVNVLIDLDDHNNRSLPGTVSWISSKAEFTPRVVQTKEQRVNLVYAVKIKVRNDGSLKIGMPAEVTGLAKQAAQ
jgi:HlyD family secretion protein